MGLKCGIVGLPNVGKSTLFNCLTNSKAQAANFPFCTIEPNIGVISVPDLRLNKISAIVNPQKVIPTTVDIVDIAGLVKGASKGEGLGNQFLGNIRETDAIIHLLRCFEDENVVHVDGSVDPVRDKEVIDTELQLKDLDTVESRLQKVEKAGKVGSDKEAARLYEVYTIIRDHLLKGLPARSAPLHDEQFELAEDLFLLTAKPVMYVCNVDENSVKDGNHFVDKVKEAVKDENAEVLILAAETEAEINQLEDEEDRKMFLADMGLDEPGLNKLIRAAYRLLKLNTYFTAGEKEVRAWTITEGMSAPEAAGVIHTDFQKGFIKAEVIKYDDYLKYGSEAACRDAGKLAIEGKNYIVSDGDIMHFKFNV